MTDTGGTVEARNFPIRCDIRGCEGHGNHRFWTEQGYAVDLCDIHRTLIEAQQPGRDVNP